MKTYRIAVLAAGAALLAAPARPQTAGELLQKGIYTQDTAGDLDGAIAIYRQIVNSGNSPRDIAAQAQYRLAQSLLEKGDLANGATEFSNLARNYADYGKLIASLAAEAGKSVKVPGGRGGRGGFDLTNGDPTRLAEVQALLDRMKAAGAFSGGGRSGPGVAPADSDSQVQQLKAEIARLKVLAEADAISLPEFERQVAELQAVIVAREQPAMTFDSNSPVTVKGTVFKFQMMNPNSTISVDPMDGSGRRYTFFLASASQIEKQGMRRNTLKMGDEVTVTGSLATGGQTMPDGTVAASATTVTTASGAKIFDRAQVTQ